MGLHCRFSGSVWNLVGGWWNIDFMMSSVAALCKGRIYSTKGKESSKPMRFRILPDEIHANVHRHRSRSTPSTLAQLPGPGVHEYSDRTGSA